MLRSSLHASDCRAARRTGLVLGAVSLLAVSAAPDARALVASCDDGSVVLAHSWEDVRCVGAVPVSPDDLPRRGWMYQDPLPELRERRKAWEAERERDLEQQLDSLPPVSAAPPARKRVVLAAGEYRDLGRLIELHQRRGGASIARDLAGLSPVRMRLAHSRAFEARLRADLAARGAPPPGLVLVFSLAPGRRGLAEGPPSFAQGGVTFRPAAGDPQQLGWISPPGVALPSGAPALGYVALPSGFDLDRPLALFWGDAVEAARLR